VARSLGKADVPVHALSSQLEPVRYSRYCASWTQLAGDRVQERWLDWLRTVGPKGAVLLPCNDEALELIARSRGELVELGYLPMEADDDVLLGMLDKDRTYQLADAAGVDRPRTVTLGVPADLEIAAESLEFPCALKPLHSHVFARHSGVGKVIVASNRAELEAAFAVAVSLDVQMLATEIVPGPEDQYMSYYSYLDERGEPLFHFTKQKLRQYPVGFGLACYQVSVWSEETAEIGLRFFQKIGLRGLGCVEFKRDARDGRLKLIECNHRFTAANELVQRSGIDLSLLAYNRALGRPIPSFNGYKLGVRIWHPLEDVRALRDSRRQGELTVGGWLMSLMHWVHLPLFRLSDPLPTITNAIRLRKLVRSYGVRSRHRPVRLHRSRRARFGPRRRPRESGRSRPPRV
jgi:D-aspartate ligase